MRELILLHKPLNLGMLFLVVGCASLHNDSTNQSESAISQLSDVTITLKGFGKAIDPLQVSMAAPSTMHTAPSPGDDVWLMIANHLDRTIQFNTNSTYLRPLDEWDQMPDGTKRLPLENGAEISMSFGIEDRGGHPVPYGSDNSWASRLSPGYAVFFSVPRGAFARGQAIHVDYVMEDPSTGELSQEHYRAYFRASDLPSNTP